MARSVFAGDLSGGFSLTTLNNQFGSLFQGDSSPLRPRAQSTPDDTIAVSASLVESFYSQIWLLATAPLNYAGGNSGSFAVPTNNRIDLLYITSGGTLTIKQGTDEASPSAPNFDADGFPICYVYCKSTMSVIVNYEDKDANSDEGYIWKDVRAIGLYSRMLLLITQGGLLTYDGSKVIQLSPGTSGYFLQSQGAGADLIYAAGLKSGDAAGGDLTGTYPNPTLETGIPKNVQAFTSSGTWTRPAGIDYVLVKVWSGGGGGAADADGALGGGGGGGGYSEGIIEVSGNVTVTVGAGGAGGTGASGNGAAGGTSSFAGDTTIQATGGGGGTGAGAGGAGGVGSNGTVNLTAQKGENGIAAANRASAGSGSPMGSSGGVTDAAPGVPGSGGGGGSGGNGGAGAAGLVIVYY